MAQASEKFPFDIEYIDENINKELLRNFTGERTGFVRVGPEKYVFQAKFIEEADKYYNVELNEDDVWIVTYPRSGTTMTQELVWLIGNDLDYNTALQIPLSRRCPFFEFGLFFNDDLKAKFLNANSHSKLNQQLIENIAAAGWQILPTIITKRYIKTHIPFSLLPNDWNRKKCKTIYVARNPKDVLVSEYYLFKLFNTSGYVGNFEQFWIYFEKNLLLWTPYWSHVKEGWERRNEPNVLFLFYENIMQDMRGSIEKIANFLGKSLTNDQIDNLHNHMNIENFRNNKSVNEEYLYELKIINANEEPFIRNGKISITYKEFTAELNERADKWIEENLRKTNIPFPTLKLI